jgi:DNA-binding IclR family transcriptional regulator
MDNSEKEETRPRAGAQAVRRALAVLRIVAAGRDSGVPLAEIVRATGLTRPTVHRLAHVLIEEGLIERNPRFGRYALGGQVQELALARPQPTALQRAAEPHLAEIAARLGDTLFLTVRTGLDTLCLARRTGSYPVQVFSIEVGARRPLGVSSAGIAILATLPAAEVRRIALANAPRLASWRTDPAAVLAQVRAARRRGYMLRDVGIVPGTRSLSAWIPGDGRRPAAALTLSALRSRLTPRREDEIAEALRAAAGAIGAAVR